MKKIRFYFIKVLRFLRARPLIGGLDISDTALRYAYYTGRQWQLKGLKVPPGILEGGKVKNAAEFTRVLRVLREEITGKKDRRPLNVIVSVSSVGAYTQALTVPAVAEGALERTVDLNLKMVSPADIDQLYYGWQLQETNKDSGTSQILSAFIDRGTVDTLQTFLRTEGFLPVALEFKSLSLVRLVRTWGAGYDPAAAYLVLVLDAEGISILVLKNGQLYFEYSTPWKEVQKEEKQLTPQALEASLIHNISQVWNFYDQHWKDVPVKQVIVASSALGAQAEVIIKNNFPLEVHQIVLKGGTQPPSEWLPALGTAIRGTTPRGQDRDISLTGVSAKEEFIQSEVLNFVRFWRVLTPLALLVLVAVFVATDIFFNSIESTLQPSEQSSQLAQKKELEALDLQARQFNALVDTLSTIDAARTPKSPVLQAISRVAAAGGITLTHFSFVNYQTPITISGLAADEATVIAFKKMLEGDARFRDISLPLSGFVTQPVGISFSMTFTMTSATSSNSR